MATALAIFELVVLTTPFNPFFTVPVVKVPDTPASNASGQPSPSESKSKRFAIPSLSVSKSKKQEAKTAKPPVPEVAVPPFILKLTSEIPTSAAPAIFFSCTIPHD